MHHKNLSFIKYSILVVSERRATIIINCENKKEQLRSFVKFCREWIDVVFQCYIGNATVYYFEIEAICRTDDAIDVDYNSRKGAHVEQTSRYMMWKLPHNFGVDSTSKQRQFLTSIKYRLPAGFVQCYPFLPNIYKDKV